MAEPHVVSALRAKYAELLGHLRQCEQRADALRAGLAHISATIRLFDPGWDGASVSAKRPKKPSRWGKAGQGIRAGLAILRAADGPMTAREIALAAMRQHGMATDHAETVEEVANSMQASLGRHVGKGVVCHGGSPRRWSVERPTVEKRP